MLRVPRSVIDTVVKQGYELSTVLRAAYELSSVEANAAASAAPVDEVCLVNKANELINAAKGQIAPPIAPQRPHKVAFGAVEGENRGEKPFLPLRHLDDPWHWMRDDEREDEEVLTHLRMENNYTVRRP